jgi:protocatechuate 3,4-dioxygenase beta subunit
MSEHDDEQIGQILSRREVLALLGTTSLALLTACAPGQATTTPAATNAVAPTPTVQRTAAAATIPTNQGTSPSAASATPPRATVAATTTRIAAAPLPACIVRPEVTEGPYYVDENLDRADVRADPRTGAVKSGAPLTLTFRVSEITSAGCTPLAGAKVEIWHCDAAGVYSDVNDPSGSTRGQQFLRGYQLTDANGQATFTTIYPGWYRGRAVHIHFKVHPTARKVFTSQLFFDDTLSDRVFAQGPYNSRGQRDRRNDRDSIYKDLLLLTTTEQGAGYAASFDIGIQG